MREETLSLLNLLNLQSPTRTTQAREANDLLTEMRMTLLLGAPLALGELGWMSTYIVDALMIGRMHHSALPIAASSLGNTIYYAIVFCAIYLLNGLETLIAQAYGRGRREECVLFLVQSFWIVVVGTPVVMLATLGGLALLPHLGTPPDIVAETTRYTRVLIWSTLPLMAYMALRRYLQSINRVALISFSLLTASVVNFVFDWVFLFGHFGSPALGVAGSAWATLVVRLYMLTLLVGGTWWALRRNGDRILRSMYAPSWPHLRALLKIGWPSGLENLEELGVSTYMSILCARLGVTLLAAHQVVLDLNAFVYQVPGGLSYATIVRVGQAAGRNNASQVRRATEASMLLGMSFMLVAATVFAAAAPYWAGLYTESHDVVVAAVPIFFVCAFLLLGDTAFVLLASALTGLGDTRTPMVVSLVWNWGIGMPLAYMLAFHGGYSLRGLWIGRAVGSVGGGLTMAALWQWRMHKARAGGRAANLNLLSTLSAAK